MWKKPRSNWGKIFHQAWSLVLKNKIEIHSNNFSAGRNWNNKVFPFSEDLIIFTMLGEVTHQEAEVRWQRKAVQANITNKASNS